jgi:hypothetical protein
MAAQGSERVKPIPIAQYLSQINRAQRHPQDSLDGSTARPRLSIAPDEGLEERVREAFERGRKTGLEAARKELEIVFARREAERAERDKSERLAFKAKEYALMAENISQGLADVEARIADSVARILKPLLIDRQAERILQALAENLTRMLSGEAPDLLRVSGPKDLLESLRTKLAAVPASVEFVEADGVDVTVTAQHTLIESQLQALAAAVDAALK